MGRRSIHLAYACAVLVATATSAVRAQAPEDTAMAQHVASSIKASGQLSNYRLGVKYQDGVAWLLGSVASQEQQEKAIELARGVEGVEQVICRLEIEGEADKLVSPVAETVADAEPSVNLASNAAEAPQPEAAVEPAATPMAKPAAATAPMPRMAQRPMARQVPRPQMPRPMSRGDAAAIRTASMQPGMQGRAVPANYCGPGCYGDGGGYAGGYGDGGGYGGGMMPQASGYVPGGGGAGMSYDNANMPGYAWPSYAAYPNYAA